MRSRHGAKVCSADGKVVANVSYNARLWRPSGRARRSQWGSLGAASRDSVNERRRIRPATGRRPSRPGPNRGDRARCPTTVGATRTHPISLQPRATASAWMVRGHHGLRSRGVRLLSLTQFDAGPCRDGPDGAPSPEQAGTLWEIPHSYQGTVDIATYAEPP
jgi:hypothetical protein